ncbi:hypothetical protein BDV28DRAFT_164451 [Aspergillus coremiiformis]|uniref:Uncharacterized protein n=1 Tax=Aspergillus coremiiformis TaxID=138285 RepID=A0A5N6Z9L2_9EURO|nr:hypothetical protein BDV28DRAFT_164451 [Aspergillus coremiiformis]
MLNLLNTHVSFTKKGHCSPRTDNQEKLANARESLSSLHTFTFNFLKNQSPSRIKYKELENSRVEIPHSQEEKIASLLANATYTQLDIHQQCDSDEDEDPRSSFSSSNTTSERNIHDSPSPSPSPPATPLLIHSELDLSATEPFPDYYESCEQNMALIDKDLEEVYKNAILKVFEESMRIKELDSSLTSVHPFTSQVDCPVTIDNHPSPAQSGISHVSQPTPFGDVTARSQTELISASEPSSAITVHANREKVASMTSVSQTGASLDNTGAHFNRVPVQRITSEVAPMPTIAPQSISSVNTGVKTRQIPSMSSSSTSTVSSGKSAGQTPPVASASHVISHTSDSEICNGQNNQYNRLSILSPQSALSGSLSDYNAGQTFFAALSGSLSLSGNICSGQAPSRALSIDAIVTPDEPPTPNFQPPIGTGRPVPGAAFQPAPNAELKRRVHEAGERKLNILEEIKIILRADTMRGDIQRRFTAMTNIVLRMEWILFRRDAKPNGTRTKEFLSSSVVEEVEELAIPMVQYLAWLDKKLQSELSISRQVLHSVIQIAKDQDLDVYQRFRQTAQMIIGNLRKPRPLEKHLLTVFQDLYDTYVYSSFLNIRNRQILREDKVHLERDNLTRLLIAGWDVLNRAIENYNEIITISNDLKNRFVEPIMDRLPNSHKIWEEEWEEHQRQCEIQRQVELAQLWAEAEESAQAEAQRQEFARTQDRAMAEFRAQMLAHGQGFGQWHVDCRISV